MRILLTSGGRLGTSLFHALRPRHEVRVLRRRPEALLGDCDVAGDVGRYADVAEAMRGCEIVFHTAVRNNTDVELASYEQFLASNVDGTFNVLLAALRLGVRRVVYSSTAMVNGFHETAAGLTPGQGSAVRYDDVAPRRGLDVYGLTKTLAEITADYFRDRHGLSVIGLRYGWFAPLDMYRDPAMVYNTLQFCFHEQDALAANLLAMDQTTVGDYLICAPTRFTDADAPELWRRPEAALARHYPGELDYLRSIGFDPTPIPAWLDCSRAMRELGYRPRFDFPRFVQMHRESHRASGR